MGVHLALDLPVSAGQRRTERASRRVQVRTRLLDTPQEQHYKHKESLLKSGQEQHYKHNELLLNTLQEHHYKLNELLLNTPQEQQYNDKLWKFLLKFGGCSVSVLLNLRSIFQYIIFSYFRECLFLPLI